MKWIGIGLLGICGLFVGSLIRNRLRRLKDEARPLQLSLDLPQGVSFHGPVIVHRKGDEYLVISARCTHLGCIIDRMEEDRLVCPCHGSTYSLEGKVLSGPASRDLPLLRHRIQRKEKRIIIELPT